MAKSPSITAVQHSVSKLSNEQVLVLYHAFQSGDTSGVPDAYLHAVEDRATSILGENDLIAGTNQTANTYFIDLDDRRNRTRKDYDEAVTAIAEYVDKSTHKIEQDEIWMRENYAKAQSEFQEAAATFAKETNTEEVTFEQATTFSEEGATWQKELVNVLKEKYGTLNSETGKLEIDASKLPEKARDALAYMQDITDELEVHSTIGFDHVIQNAGMKEFDDKSVESYRGSGTDGTADDLEGIGGSDFGDGVGKGGNGKGRGSGFGTGDGDGGDGLAEGSSGGHNSDGTSIGTAAIPATSNAHETDAIAAYLSMINGDAPINNIFHNNFYSNDPVAQWSFSIDFIPTVNLAQNPLNLIDYGRTLTKAVLNTRIPDRTVKSVVSHYKGMSIELPARAKTAGTLSMTFAENEVFAISTILDDLYQFARSNTYFENIDNALSQMTFKSEEERQRQIQILRSYRHALPTSGHLYNILVKLYRMKDVRALDDVDEEEYPTFVYFFKGCDVKTVSPIEFDYNNDKPVDVSCEWVYQYFEEMTFTEYLQRYGSKAYYDAALEDITYEASQDEMIAAADAATPLRSVDYGDAKKVNEETKQTQQLVAPAETKITTYKQEGFDAERETKIAEYTTKRLNEELSKGTVKDEQTLMTKLNDEAHTAYAAGKL